MRRHIRKQFVCLAVLGAGICLLNPVERADAANVLMTATSSATLDSLIETKLESLGHTVTVGPEYTSFDDMVNLAGYHAVLLLTNYNWPNGDMPLTGQTALLSYISSGGGMVTGEWLVWKIGALMNFQTLQDAIPVAPTAIFSGPSSITYTKVTDHPVINAGLPDSFVFMADSISGSETEFVPRPGATILYDSDNPLGAGVIGWDYGSGWVISFSTLIAETEIADDNFSRLLSNALNINGIPEPASFSLLCLGGLLTLRRRARVSMN